MDVDLTTEQQALLDRYLAFYESLANKSRHPKTAAQRRFQDVAWGVAPPETEHEIAYVAYLRKHNSYEADRVRAAPPPVELDEIDKYPPGCRPIPFEIAEKWDEPWVDVPSDDWVNRI